MPPKNRDLPDETLTRIAIHMENSAPNPDKPKLSRKDEKRHARIDELAREFYVGSEEIVHRLKRVVRAIKDELDEIDRPTNGHSDDDKGK